VAYLLIDVTDGNAHVEQVSVHPEHARRGLGRTLLDTAAAWAEQRGLAALTLTTYSDVPWNAPYYEQLGFQIMAETQISNGFRRIREHEQARGLAGGLASPCGAPSAASASRTEGLVRTHSLAYSLPRWWRSAHLSLSSPPQLLNALSVSSMKAVP
jgi:tRNA(Met) C34 N-acetyltransferase TmcA